MQEEEFKELIIKLLSISEGFEEKYSTVFNENEKQIHEIVNNFGNDWIKQLKENLNKTIKEKENLKEKTTIDNITLLNGKIETYNSIIKDINKNLKIVNKFLNNK